MPAPVAPSVGRLDDTTELVDPLTLRQDFDRRAEAAQRTDRGSRLRGWNPARSQTPPRRDLVPPEQRQRPLVPPLGGPDLTPRPGPPPTEPLLRPAPPSPRPRPAPSPGRPAAPPAGQPEVSGDVYRGGAYPTGSNEYAQNGYANGRRGPGTQYGTPVNAPEGYPTTYIPRGNGARGQVEPQYAEPQYPEPQYPEPQYAEPQFAEPSDAGPPPQWPAPPADPYQTGYVANMPTTGMGQPTVEEAANGVAGAYGPGPRQIGHPRPARIAEITGATAVVRVQAVDAFGEEDIDQDDAAPVEGGYRSAALATLAWYSVPAVLYLAYAFYLGGAVRPGCVSVNGGACLSPRAEALNAISNNIGLIAIAVVLSTVIAIMLRWATTGWRSLAIGFAAAVVGAGATTVLITTFSGGG
jgi:hypothetical protein